MRSSKFKVNVPFGEAMLEIQGNFWPGSSDSYWEPPESDEIEILEGKNLETGYVLNEHELDSLGEDGDFYDRVLEAAREFNANELVMQFLEDFWND